MQNNTPLKEYKLQKEEVDGIYEMDINDGIAFFSDKILNAKHEDFTSDSKKPWLWLFNEARHYLNGHYDNQITEVDIKNHLEIF